MPNGRDDRVTLLLDEEGPGITSSDDAADLVGTALSRGADVVAIPVARLDDAFFEPATGLADDLVDTLAAYRLRLVVVGDVTDRGGAGGAFDAWVRDAERRDRLRFAADATAVARLTGGAR
ncbi:DUF4180 domain-containing protein [Agromyces sp. MMS24-K17]|uniref:DUF4180 domain-containing protein n=1 Tax=Agromyces sp. MMS24-K17 TaxID=3372850 RepID=UPI003754CFB8